MPRQFDIDIFPTEVEVWINGLGPANFRRDALGDWNCTSRGARFDKVNPQTLDEAIKSYIHASSYLANPNLVKVVVDEYSAYEKDKVSLSTRPQASPPNSVFNTDRSDAPF